MNPPRLSQQEMDEIAAAGRQRWLPPGFHAVVALGLLSLAAFAWVLL